MNDTRFRDTFGSVLSIIGLGVTTFGTYSFSEPAGLVLSGVILMAVGTAMLNDNEDN